MGNNNSSSSSPSPRNSNSNQTPSPFPRHHQPPPPQQQQQQQQQQPPCYYPPPAQNYGYSAPPYAPQPPNYSFNNGWYSSHHPASSSGWGTAPVAQPPPQRTAPPPQLQQNAKKIKNDVNVHKDSIRVEVDEFNPDHFLVSFVLDAVFDGSITIYFFAKEEDNCKLTPLMAEAFEPVKVPFQKGLGQKFCQPSGTGIDLGFFALDELAKPSPDGDTYPLVIAAEICSVSHQTGDEDADAGHSSPTLQITQAVLEKNSGGPFQVKVVKQILWIDGYRYEVHDLYGIANSSGKDYTDDDSGKECVICMTEPKDTAVMPCRHMCLCSGCAEQLRLQSSKCPICRQVITELIQIKLNDNDQ